MKVNYLKRNVKKIIVSSLVMFMSVGSMSNIHANTVESNGLRIAQLSDSNFIINDEEAKTTAVLELNPKDMSGVITYENGEKSYLSTETKYDEDGNVKETVAKIDGTVIVTGSPSKENISQEELDMDKSTERSYSYDFIHRYEMSVNATSSKTNIATALLGVVGILYTTLGICTTIAGLVMTLYNELIVPKVSKVSVNVLFSKNAPTQIKYKNVWRIYKKNGSLAKMHTAYRSAI
ncbi:MAG: hypothetical protein E6X43_03345 [Peptostreptococcaceae bacterium]|nr:hypothetical protein [Peptostreptococcaceae bacterium]